MARDCEGGSGRYRGSRTLPVCNCQFQNTSSAIATLFPICYLSQLKHLDMNAIVSGKHARSTSFGKPKPSNLWEWTNVTNYNHYVIFNFFLGLFFLAASPYHVIPCNFCLLFYSSIYSVYSCFFLINLIKTSIGQSKYSIPQTFSRCLISLRSNAVFFTLTLHFY